MSPLSVWITEGFSLLEAASALAVNTISARRLGVDAAYEFLKNQNAKKTGVLFLYWNEPRWREDLEDLKKRWPETKAKLAKEFPLTWEYQLFRDVHFQSDPEDNDGERYPNDDPRTVWAPDVRAWYAVFLPKLKAVKVDVSDILVSPKTGFPGFKITLTPSLAELPKYTGKNIKPAL